MRESGYFSRLRELLTNQRSGRKGALARRRRAKRASPFRMEQLEARVLLAGDLAGATLQAAVVQEQYTEGAINIQNGVQDSGYRYRVRQDFGTQSDSSAAPTVSVLRIYENGVELGPAHSRHDDIATKGQGRFSHWVDNLYFSASDNSNPLTNGRSYTYRIYTDGSTSTTSSSTNTTTSGTTTTSTYVQGSINMSQAIRDSGYRYEVRQDFGTASDSNAEPTISKLRIYENGVELGPAHSRHDDIATKGQGRFSHWGDNLYFSSSDNSNPLTNGRSYTYRVYTDGSTSTTTTSPSTTTTSPTTTTTTTSSGSVKTDFGVYKEPALPSLPSAGSKIVDPTFGTTIMRLTDSKDGSTDAFVGYSNLPSFNRDNTYVMAVEQLGQKRAKFYAFDPVNFKASGGFVLSKPPAGLQEYGLIWSGVNRQVTFGVGQNKIWQVDVSTQQATLVKDLTSYGAGGYITQMSKSLNDDVFSASIVNSSGSTVGYVVYKRSTDQVLVRKLVSGLDETQVDKSGRYFIAVYKDGHDEIWDLQAGPKLTATLSGSSGFKHRDTGFGTAFTSYSGNSLGFRQLSSPTTVKALVPGYWGYSANNQQDHFSLLADNEGWGLASRYSTTGSGVAKTFDNEIVLVATNGSNQVRRLAHHRSVVNDYYDQPKANISRDGQFIAFTSNWGNASGRRDVYIVKVPPAPVI
ncbi:MAG: LEPR-XLL domain-containing protein [Nitrospirales bacterium]|nr:LEPR-XLL domain-containing protein [Nitrospirales bacterium]